MNSNRRALLGISAAFVLLSLANSPQEMFQGIRSKTSWNADGDLLWGYFFMDPQQEKLKPLAAALAAAGYRVASIGPSQDGRTHVLHVEKVETHTPQSLNERNIEFYRLAEKYGVATYDGMDIGPVGPSSAK